MALSEVVKGINNLYACPLQKTQPDDRPTYPTLERISDLLSLEGATLPDTKEDRYEILKKWTKSLWSELQDAFKNAVIQDDGADFRLNSGVINIVIDTKIASDRFTFRPAAAALRELVSEITLPIFIPHLSNTSEIDRDRIIGDQKDTITEIQANQQNFFNVLGGFNEGARQICAILDVYLDYEIENQRDIPSTSKIQAFLHGVYIDVLEITKLNFWADKFFDTMIDLGGNPYQCVYENSRHTITINQDALDSLGKFLSIINQAETNCQTATCNNSESILLELTQLLTKLTGAQVKTAAVGAKELLERAASYYSEPENHKTVICPATTSGVLPKWYGELSRLLVQYYDLRCARLLKYNI